MKKQYFAPAWTVLQAPAEDILTSSPSSPLNLVNGDAVDREAVWKIA